MARTAVPANMATESPDQAAEPESEPDAEWLSQETVQDQQETETGVLPVSGDKVRYRLMAPEKFASLVDHYGITDMAKDLGDIDENADLADPEDIDIQDVDAEDLDELDDKFRVMLFYRDVIVPQIDKPERVHWADPEHMQDPAWVDMSELPAEDKLFLVAKVTGQDPDQLQEAAQDRVDRFQT